MKTNAIIASALALLASAAVSCSDDYDIYPAEYESVVMIKNSGEQPVAVYSTDDVATFTFTILKGGTSKKEAGITLRPMTQEEFDAYLTESGRPYSLLPADCYSFSADGHSASTSVTFGADDTYKDVAVYLDADAVGQFLSGFDASLYSAVIPVVIESADASVNADNDNAFIIPSYSQPTLMFADDLLDASRSRGLNLSDDGTFTTTVRLPIENRWDLEFDLAVDPAILDAYNSAHGTSYTAMSADAIIGSTHFSMPAGKSSVTVSFKINSDLIDLTDALPLRITNSSVDGIDPDAENSWLVADLNIPITADMLSTNALEPSEGSLANLLDGSLQTYFHSSWSVAVDTPHYLQIELPKSYTKVQIEYSNRVSGSPNALGVFNLYAGQSAAALDLVRQFNKDVDALKGGSGETTILQPLSLDKPANVFRIENVSSFQGNKFFVMTELKMRGL